MALPLLTGAAPVIGGLLGSIFGGGREDQARELQERLVRDYDRINVPTAESMQVNPEMLQQLGQLDPRLEQSILAGRSEYDAINVDPRLRQAQLNALSGLQGISDSGGMTLQEQANLQRMLTDIGAADRGRRQAITQNLQQRGIGGSGFELASQLQNAQDAAQLASQQGLDINAQAQQRALQALQQGGQLGGQIEDRSFGQQADAARANDLIKQFNIQNQIGQQQRNVGSQNRAQELNLGERQRIGDANVDLRNQNQVRNAGLRQQQFLNNLNKLNAKSGSVSNLAQNYKDAGKSTRDDVIGVVSGLGRYGRSL
jgi:hypothetical protein